MTEDISFPIGKFLPQPFSQKQKEEWLLDIKFLPSELELAVQNLDEHQLHTSYREGGWTVFDFYTQWKVVYIDYSGGLQRAQIDVD